MRSEDRVTVYERDAFDGRAAHFGREVQTFRHGLHHQPVFTDEGLVELLDRYPRQHVGVFTMGETPDSWRRGRLGEIAGAELLNRVREGRLWLNLRGASEHDQEMAVIRDAIFAETRANVPGFRPFRTDAGLLISSPNARVFYHLDIPRVMLFHLRGHKRFYVYPREAGYIQPRDLENVARGLTEEEIPYVAGLDAGAQVLDLNPGDMVHWPQNAPHRIDNGDDLNVSLSVEFMTPLALMRANALYANGWLRDRFGWQSGLEWQPSASWAWKAPLAQILRKVVASRRARPAPLPPSFTLGQYGLQFD